MSAVSIEHFSEESNHISYTIPVFVFFITLSIGILLIYIWIQNQRFFKMGNKIPGPPTLPFLGNAHYVIGKSHNEIFNMTLDYAKEKMYKNVARLWIGPRLLVFLVNPVDVELILSSQIHINKADEYKFFKPWLGNGLLISSGNHWRSHRKLIAPAFHQNVLKTFIKTFNSSSAGVIKKMECEIGKVFDVHNYMSETTVDILLETVMGHKRVADNDEGFKYAMAVMKMCDILHARQLRALLRFDTIFNMTNLKSKQTKLLDIIHAMTKKVIKARKEKYETTYSSGSVPLPSLPETITNDNYKFFFKDEMEEIDENDVGEKRRLAFLDLMIETAKNGANLTDTDIKEEVDTIMFEGHDTTAAGVSFVLCLLGIHQNVQEKIYNELKQIFDDSDREATFADTLEMKYLERVILESLRLYPPVPAIARKLTEDVQLISENYILPAGSTVIISNFVIHRRADIYENPNEFNPDNFLPETAAKRHYYSFVPFSAGPRSCVGRKYAMLKLKILLSSILRKYHIKSNLTEADFKLQADIILKRTDGFRIEIEPRN